MEGHAQDVPHAFKGAPMLRTRAAAQLPLLLHEAPGQTDAELWSLSSAEVGSQPRSTAPSITSNSHADPTL